MNTQRTKSTDSSSYKEENSEPRTWDKLDECEEASKIDVHLSKISDSIGGFTSNSHDQRIFDYAVRTDLEPTGRPQTPVKIILPREELVLNYLAYSENNDDLDDLKFLEKSKKLESRESVTLKDHTMIYLQKSRGSLSLSTDTLENSDDSESNRSRVLYNKSSRIGLYNTENVDSMKVMEIIERELRILTGEAPPLASAVENVQKIISHYKECSRCTEKVRLSLPWILFKIQELVKFVTVKKNKLYIWPNDQSYVKLSQNLSLKSANGESKEEVKESVTRSSIAQVKGEKSSTNSNTNNFTNSNTNNFTNSNNFVTIGRSEKVEAFAITEDKPGVQILLEFEIEQTENKRLFENISSIIQQNFSPIERNLTYEPIENSDIRVLQILQPDQAPSLSVQSKRETKYPKEVKTTSCLLFRRSYSHVIRGIISSPVGSAVRSSTLSSNRKVTKNQRKEDKEGSEKSNSDEKILHSQVNVSVSEEDLLWYVEEEMAVQKVRELETEVKGLKDLMLEVHKNQLELSKVLLQKGVYSQPIIKLTDPNMLKEENQIISKAAEIGSPGNKSSVESLQVTINELKEKCSIKNKMILTLLKGLRADIPKEWWDDFITDESMLPDDFDAEKLNNFIRKTSISLMNENKDSSAPSAMAPNEDYSSEEESYPVRENLKVDVESGESGEALTTLKDLVLKSNYSQGMLGEENTSILTVLTIPTSSIPPVDLKTELSLKKLENQILLLNTENDRLWHEISDLKEVLRSSATERKEAEEAFLDTQQKAIHLGKRENFSGKAINLTIRIAEKDLRCSSNDGILPGLPSIGANPIGNEKSNVAAEQSLRGSGLVKYAILNPFSETDKTFVNARKPPEDILGKNYARRVSVKIFKEERQNKSCSKSSDRRRSENDLHYLEDSIATVSEYGNVPIQQDQSRIQTSVRLRNRSVSFRPKRSNQQGLVHTPHPSEYNIYRPGEVGRTIFRPIACVPSEYVIPEAIDVHRAGPSSSLYVGDDEVYLLQKPSVMQLSENQTPVHFAVIGNERELQTIPESEDHGYEFPSSSLSQCLNKTIQRLRNRVKAIHKNVAIMKAKNEEMDNFLEKMLTDAVENGYNFENIENDINTFKDKLG